MQIVILIIESIAVAVHTLKQLSCGVPFSLFQSDNVSMHEHLAVIPLLSGSGQILISPSIESAGSGIPVSVPIPLPQMVVTMVIHLGK